MPHDRGGPSAGLLAGEGLGRLAFHGTALLLTAFLAQGLFLGPGEAVARYHLFVGLAALAPLLGAWLGRGRLGRPRALLLLAACGVAGQLALAAFTEGGPGLELGLVLAAAGAGALAPCAAAGFADRRALPAVAWRLVAAAAAAALPWLLAREGARAAFGVPAALAGAALVARWLARRAPAGPGAEGLFPVFGVVAHAVRRLGTGRAGQTWLDVAREAYPAAQVEDAAAVVRVLRVLVPAALFWALFWQHGSAWVLQAARLDRRLLGLELLPGQVQALEPLLALALLPVLAGVVLPALERRGLHPTALGRMTAGLYLAVGSFAAAAALQAALDAGRQPAVAWQLLQFGLMAAAEVLVTSGALELAGTLAPPSARGAVLGLWTAVIGAGNLLAAAVSALEPFRGAGHYAFFAVAMLASARLFQALSRRLRPAGEAGGAGGAGAVAS